MEAIKHQLNEMVRSWGSFNLTGLNEEINSIVCDINQLEHKYLTIHDSGFSSSSMRTTSVSSLPRPHKDSSPLVPPRSRLSLQSNIALHKSSCPSVSATIPESCETYRRRTIGPTISVPLVENRTTPIRKRHPIRPRPHRRSYNISPSVERRLSLPLGVRYQSASISENSERRSSSTGLARRSTTFDDQPEIVFVPRHQTKERQRSHSTSHQTKERQRSHSTSHQTKERQRSHSTSHNTRPPLPPRHRHSLSPSYVTTYQRFFEPVLDELNEEEEPYDIVQPLPDINPQSHNHSAPNRKDVEGLPVLANIQAKLLIRNSTLKHKTRPIITKKRSLNDSDDGDSESDSNPKQKNVRQRRRSSYNPIRKVSLPKSVRPYRKSYDYSVKLDIESKSVDIAFSFVPINASSDGQNKIVTPKKVIIRFHSINITIYSI